jgi:hypothetical protein
LISIDQFVKVNTDPDAGLRREADKIDIYQLISERWGERLLIVLKSGNVYREVRDFSPVILCPLFMDQYPVVL